MKLVLGWFYSFTSGAHRTERLSQCVVPRLSVEEWAAGRGSSGCFLPAFLNVTFTFILFLSRKSWREGGEYSFVSLCGGLYTGVLVRKVKAFRHATTLRCSLSDKWWVLFGDEGRYHGFCHDVLTAHGCTFQHSNFRTRTFRYFQSKGITETNLTHAGGKGGSRKKEGKGQQEQLHEDTEYQFSAHLDGIFVARHGGRLGYAH